jgi:hypothetical protein
MDEKIFCECGKEGGTYYACERKSICYGCKSLKKYQHIKVSLSNGECFYFKYDEEHYKELIERIDDKKNLYCHDYVIFYEQVCCIKREIY